MLSAEIIITQQRGQLAQHEDTSTVQLSGDLFSGRWGTDGEWMLGIVGGYSDNQWRQPLEYDRNSRR
ncbi:autotransporter outer membrane beta-barrel domain-containing protein [Escherichia coli]|nr:autotransporter outer membrane beta-barrel domain-containing protein [Escherichia coli]